MKSAFLHSLYWSSWAKSIS